MGSLAASSLTPQRQNNRADNRMFICVLSALCLMYPALEPPGLYIISSHLQSKDTHPSLVQVHRTSSNLFVAVSHQISLHSITLCLVSYSPGLRLLSAYSPSPL